ncbi:MAG: RNA methyltransferase [Candidatus Sericytochromatia bacterium]|nr:RNA methyltransferase [Candidatus Sericytochromatia bacterium]
MSLPLLTSIRNPRVQQVRRLHDGRGRREAGVFVVEGTRLLEALLVADWPVREVYVVPEREGTLPAAWRDRTTVVASHVYAAMSTLEHPEGVLAVVELPVAPRMPAVRPDSLWLALDGLQDPGNVGALIRTADAAGVEAVLLGPGCADPFQPKVVRASMGSVFHVPMVRVPDMLACCASTRASGMRWVATTLDDAVPLWHAALAGPLCWWMGREGTGLPKAALAAADIRVHIPMPGRAESLNAAAAAAVCLFETARRRRPDEVRPAGS